MSEPQVITTERGTRFTVEDDLVKIAQHGQPDCTMHLDDLHEFYAQLFNDEDDDIEDDPE